jgi:hypothetical protein
VAKRPMDKDIAWRALLDATRILNGLRVPYCLDGGTLLGMVRDGWFFPHDKDIDLTLLDQHDALSAVKARAKHKRFSVWQHRLVGAEGSMKLQLRRHGVMVDIVSKHQIDDAAVWALISEPERVKRMPARYYQNLATLAIREHEFSVPAETEAYLAERFGADWRTPKPDWNRWRDDRAYPEVRS